MCTLLACPDYYGASAPSPCLQRTVRLSRHRGWSPRGGTGTRWFPCSPRVDRPGRHPALPRQHRHGYAAGLHRDLPTGTPSQLRSQPPPAGMTVHCTYPPDLSRCHAYGALPPVPVRMPSGLARRTRTIWQSWHVPALSALLAALPGTSRIRLRSASTRLLRQPGEKAFHLLRLSAPHGAPAPRGAHTKPTQLRAPGKINTGITRTKRYCPASDGALAKIAPLAHGSPHAGQTG